MTSRPPDSTPPRDDSELENAVRAALDAKDVDGKRDGAWTWWRQDGSVWRTATFVAGKEQQPPAPARP